MAVIGFDSRATEPGFKAHYGRGTGRYATELLKAISLLDPPDMTIRPLGSDAFKGRTWEELALKCLPFGRQSFNTQVFLPAKLGRIGVDYFHFMAHGDATSRCRVPYYVTVLDLIPMRFPDLYRANKPGWRFDLARRLETEAIRGARGILAISLATKKDVVELLGINPERVVVTHLAAGEQFRPRPLIFRDWNREARQVKDRLGLPPERPMLLYAGGIDARKNIPFLLEVFAEVMQYRFIEQPVLVLAGAYEKDDQLPYLKREISRLGLDNDVRLIGFVPEEDLPGLYRAAHLKVFPSLYEGFGLPVLEAMASGVPVVAGANSSVLEVGGNAALLLPDKDREQWAEEIISVLLNETRQGQLSQAGKNQARRFSWASTAERTLLAYRYFAELKPISAAEASIPDARARTRTAPEPEPAPDPVPEPAPSLASQIEAESGTGTGAGAGAGSGSGAVQVQARVEGEEGAKR